MTFEQFQKGLQRVGLKLNQEDSLSLWNKAEQSSGREPLPPSKPASRPHTDDSHAPATAPAAIAGGGAPAAAPNGVGPYEPLSPTANTGMFKKIRRERTALHKLWREVGSRKEQIERALDATRDQSGSSLEKFQHALQVRCSIKACARGLRCALPRAKRTTQQACTGIRRCAGR